MADPEQKPLAYRYLGRSGVRVSEICLGTMTFGKETGEAEAHAMLDAFVARGGNFIDTADVYNDGASERIIGTWLAARPAEQRRNLVVATKTYFGGGNTDPNGTGLSRMHIENSVSASLANLRTGHIDLLQIHNWDAETPPEVWLPVMRDLITGGRVRMFGVCNVTGWQLQRILSAAERVGVPVVSAQMQYNLLARGIEWEVLDCCQHAGVSVLPWSPLKGGWLTGKMRRGEVPGTDTRVGAVERSGKVMQSAPSYSMFAEGAKGDATWRLLDAMKEVGAACGGVSTAQVALWWLLGRPCVASVIIGARDAAQLRDNLGAAGRGPLPAEHAGRLTKLSAGELPYPYEMVWRACRGARGRVDAKDAPPGLFPVAQLYSPM